MSAFENTSTAAVLVKSADETINFPAGTTVEAAVRELCLRYAVQPPRGRIELEGVVVLRDAALEAGKTYQFVLGKAISGNAHADEQKADLRAQPLEGGRYNFLCQ